MKYSMRFKPCRKLSQIFTDIPSPLLFQEKRPGRDEWNCLESHRYFFRSECFRETNQLVSTEHQLGSRKYARSVVYCLL